MPITVPDDAARSTTIGGSSLHYLDVGAGPPLLLVHGLGNSSTVWRRCIGGLALHYRVVALDLPGHGRSDGPAQASYDPPYFAAVILEFIARLQLGAIDAIGSSLGALALLLAALERPAAFKRLVLVNPAGFTAAPRPPLGDAALALVGLWLSFPRTRALIRAGYGSAFYDASSADEETITEIYLRQVNVASMRAARLTLRALFHYCKHLKPFHQRLAHLASPVLLVWGKNDPSLPWQDSEIAKRVLPAPRIELFDRCGHLPHVERTDAFNALVLEFLKVL